MSVQYRGKTRKVKKFVGGGFQLNLSGKKITDISQIKGLDQLTDLIILDLSYNNISEINGLDSLHDLKKLDLEGNKITEIKGLDNLTKLKTLNLSQNNINELKGLQNLKNLENLRIRQNPVTEWMEANFGTRYYEQGVVEYCRKEIEGEDYDSSRVENLINQTMNDIERMIKATPQEWKGSGKEALKKLIHMYNTVARILRALFKKLYDRTMFYDLLGKLFSRNPEFFDSRFSNEYNFWIAPIFSTKFEMESYILENYCFIEGEYFTSRFNGTFTYGKYTISGRIYATNYRIIGHGNYEIRKGRGHLDVEYILRDTDFVLMDLLTFLRGKVTNVYAWINSLMGRDLNSKEFPIFGYQFPIFHAKKIKLTNKSLKIDQYHVKVNRLDNESKTEFIERSLAIFTQISNNLMENKK